MFQVLDSEQEPNTLSTSLKGKKEKEDGKRGGLLNLTT